MDRTKLNHEVGSVYVPEDRRRKAAVRFEGDNFDETFMEGVIGSCLGSMAIFGVLIAIVLFV